MRNCLVIALAVVSLATVSLAYLVSQILPLTYAAILRELGEFLKGLWGG